LLYTNLPLFQIRRKLRWSRDDGVHNVGDEEDVSSLKVKPCKKLTSGKVRIKNQPLINKINVW
jgi:hypothetical protein